MSRTITLHQLCWTSVPRGVRQTSGWQFLARSRGFDAVDTVQAHCTYEMPRQPRSRTDDQMPVDYGFRILGASHACIYRTVYAGVDDFNRPGNYLTHTLVFPLREDDALEKFDADVPALFAWADNNRVFCDTWEDVRNRCTNGSFVLDPVTIENVDELTEWRRGKDEARLIDCLVSYPEERRRTVASDALRAALAPPEQRRPVVWIAPENGLDNSHQDYDIIKFLFAALPYAWRRNATFSTYRRSVGQAGFQWFGLTSDGPGKFSLEQRRYEYFIINSVDPGESSELPTIHPWIQRILDGLNEPPAHSEFGKATRFAHVFRARDDRDLYDPDGFLHRIERGRQVLQNDRGDFKVVLPLLDSARPSLLLLDNLNNYFGRTVRAGKRAWPGDVDLQSLGRGYGCLLDGLATQVPAALASSPRCDSIYTCLKQLLDDSYDGGRPEVSRPLFEAMRANRVPRDVCGKLIGDWTDRLGSLLERHPDLDTLTGVLEFLSPYFGEKPEDGKNPISTDIETRRKRIDKQIRDTLSKKAKELGKDLIESARQEIYPYCKSHTPANLDELEGVLNLLAVVRRKGGEDLVPDYLSAICKNLPDPRPSLIDLDGRYRYLLLQYKPAWDAIEARLPQPWQELIQGVSAEALWSSFWECRPQLQPDLLDAQLETGLRKAQDLAPFVTLCRKSGLATISARLRQLEESPGPRLGLNYCMACAQVLEAVINVDPQPQEILEQILVRLLSLLFRDCAQRDLKSVTEVLERTAEVFWKLLSGSPENRLECYCCISRQTLRWIEAQALDHRRLPDAAYLNAWVKTFRKITEGDDVEAIAVRTSLSCAFDAATSREALPTSSEDVALSSRCRIIAQTLVESVTVASTRWHSFLLEKVNCNDPKLTAELRAVVREAVRRKDSDCSTWVIPGRPGWKLLEAITDLKRHHPTETLVKGQDWVGIARLHRAATHPATREMLDKYLENALVSCFKEARRDPTGFVRRRRLAEMAYLLAELPGRYYERKEEVLEVLSEIDDALYEIEETECKVLGSAPMVVLGLWFHEAHVRRAMKFWGMLRVFAMDSKDRSFLQHLSATSVPVAPLAEVARWDIDRRTRLAINKLQLDKRPAMFARFLSTVGDRIHPDQSTTENPAGCEATALALATYLVAAYEENPQPDEIKDSWKGRLKRLVAEKAWETVVRERNLNDPERWERFEKVVRRVLQPMQPTQIPVDQVLKILRSRSLLSYLFFFKKARAEKNTPGSS